MNKNIQFYEVWSYDASELQTVKISFMVSSNQIVVDSKLNEEYIKSFYDDENEYNLRRIQREHKAKLGQKFYFNALITYANGKSFRTKGFSLYRNQIPDFISALTKIVNGEFDNNLTMFEKNHRNPPNDVSDIVKPISTGIKNRITPHSAKPRKIVSKIEHLTDEEIVIRKKHKLSDEEFNKYMEDIKNLSKKRN